MKDGIREVMTMMNERIDYCTECGKETGYLLRKQNITKRIRDKEYTFAITTAICTECGAEMSLPGLIDQNVREIDAQYRAAEGLVCAEDIERLMKIYRIGKAPLSLALGFGEITITRYLEGQVPSREYSDVIKKALVSPAFMRHLLHENRERLTDAAYQKAMSAADSMQQLFSVSEKMLRVIAYIFDRLEEVTPLTLQKLLYFSQGIYSAVYSKPLFAEDCQAWVHGPVYPEVYELFRDFKYNPIDDARFAILQGTDAALTEEEKVVIDLVTDTFGMYGGKTLERITHNELPWRSARDGYGDGIPSHAVLPKEQIMQYYRSVDQQYHIRTAEGLQNYIGQMLRR